jgi:hypothetical protein
MDWNAIAAIAEIVAAAGVIVSLLYLAAQVRHSTRAAKAATRQAIARDLQALSHDLITGSDIASILYRHIAGEPVESDERMRLHARAYRDFHFWDNAHYQYTEGMLSDEEWRGIRENLKQLMLYLEAYREYWSGEHSSFSKRFQVEVDRMLSESYEGRGSTVIEAYGGRAEDSVKPAPGKSV